MANVVHALGYLSRCTFSLLNKLSLIVHLAEEREETPRTFLFWTIVTWTGLLFSDLALCISSGKTLIVLVFALFAHSYYVRNDMDWYISAVDFVKWHLRLWRTDCYSDFLLGLAVYLLLVSSSPSLFHSFLSTYFSRPPSGIIDVMSNIFLVIRTVSFALLAYLHVLILVFASWNIIAAKLSGMSAPGASIFLLASSIFTLVLVLIACLAQLICTTARPAHVRVECAWTALLSNFQLATSINVIVNRPSTCFQTRDSPRAICASSSLLAHVSWLAAFILLSYCLALCVATITHVSSVPDVWITPVPLVPWFRPDTETPNPVIISHLPGQKRMNTSSSWSSHGSSCSVSKYIAERWEKLSRTESQPVPSSPILFTRGRQSVDSARPAWACQQTARRGIDNPFGKLLPERKEPVVMLDPGCPSRTLSSPGTPSKDPALVTTEQSEAARSYSYSPLTPRTPTVFPQEIDDPDLPIPLPSPSKWVRADDVSGLFVRRESISSSHISCLS